MYCTVLHHRSWDHWSVMRWRVWRKLIHWWSKWGRGESEDCSVTPLPERDRKSWYLRSFVYFCPTGLPLLFFDVIVLHSNAYFGWCVEAVVFRPVRSSVDVTKECCWYCVRSWPTQPVKWYRFDGGGPKIRNLHEVSYASVRIFRTFSIEFKCDVITVSCDCTEWRHEICSVLL
jgi:hypothetical protein